MSSRGGTASSNAARAQLTTASFVPNAQVRPTTQQGFIAQRPQTRLGSIFRINLRFTVFLAGMGRQIADKTYFLGLLNTQLNMLNKEIDSLSTELARAVKEQQNLLIYEQRLVVLEYNERLLEPSNKPTRLSNYRINWPITIWLDYK